MQLDGPASYYFLQRNSRRKHPLEEVVIADPDNGGSDSIACATVVSNGIKNYPGLEELRFWQAFYCTRDNMTNISNTYVQQQLSSDMGYIADVPFPTLLVCSLSCGPFVYNLNAYEPAANWMNHVFSTLYDLIARRTLFVWALFSTLLLMYQFRSNRLAVIQSLHLEKEVMLRTIGGSLERKVQKLEKQIQVHRQQTVNRGAANT